VYVYSKVFRDVSDGIRERFNTIFLQQAQERSCVLFFEINIVNMNNNNISNNNGQKSPVVG
jgi:hypothetical protein